MKNVIRNIEIEELDEDTIEREKLFNVFVFGLPRSGTSMTTKIIELLGVNMIYTSEENRQQHDKRYQKLFGEYHPNKTGFYEITKNPVLNFLKLISKPYSGCKMIIPVQGFRWQIVSSFASKVIIAKRNPEEIRQSQMAYYRNDNIRITTIASFWVNEEVRLKEHNIDFMEVYYNNILKNPVKEITKIKEFIKSDMEITNAVKFVDPKQNRFKKENLIEGI